MRLSLNATTQLAILLALSCSVVLGCATETGSSGGGLCQETPRTFGFIAKRIDFAQRSEDGLISQGFDLDSRVSDETDTVSCRRTDFTAPDGTPGIDNQFTYLYETLLNLFDDAVDGLIQGVINDGSLLLMVELEGVDDLVNDDCVTVRVFSALGTPDLGTDGFIAPGQTFDLDGDKPVSTTTGYIEDGVVHAGPFDTTIPIAILQVFFDLRVGNAILRAEIHDDLSVTAMMAGAIENDQILDVARMAEEMQMQQLTPLLRPALRGLADLHPDPVTGLCDQLSATLLVDGTPAFLFEDSL